MKSYGRELIIDLHNCDILTFNRKSIRKFFKLLCEVIDMKAEKLCWWDDHGLEPEYQQKEPHTKGTTAVQFILTSNITIHTLDILKNVYINIFSCKDFDAEMAMKFSIDWFKGELVNSHIIERK
ncbi:MAG TPA: S-adenosylmethionine decarboxylase [Ignavibacteriaceae bacterium]|nr:S-adenosylmethionine decarboxylase [Ignavibacteriaceae bacterium]